MSAKRCASAALAGVSAGMKISPTPEFGLADLLLEQPLLVGHVGVGDLRPCAEHLAQHACPADLHADLVDQRAVLDIVAGQALAQRAGRHAVARSTSAIALAMSWSDTTMRRRSTSCSRSRSSISWRVICGVRWSSTSGVHRQAGGQREQPAAVVDIITADDIAIDDGNDLCRPRLGRRSSGGHRCRQRGPRRPPAGQRRSGPKERNGGSWHAKTPASPGRWHQRLGRGPQSPLNPNVPTVLRVIWNKIVESPLSPSTDV